MQQKAIELGKRVRSKREQREMRLRDLRKATGLPLARLQRIETDPDRKINLDDVLLIARALDVPAHWLLEGSPVRDRVLASARTTDGAAAEEAVNRAVDALETHSVFDELGVAAAGQPGITIEPRNPGEAPSAWGRRTAESVRDRWGVPSGPIPDLPTALEQHERVYVILDSFPESVDGVCLVDPDTGAAAIAASTTEQYERQRFTLAHELGHLYAGEHKIEPVIDAGRSQSETAASEFARNLLLPHADAVSEGQAHGPHPWTEHEIATLAWKYRVTPQVAAIQLRRAGVIPDQQVNAVSQLNADAWSRVGGWQHERSAAIASSSAARIPTTLLARAIAGWHQGLVSARTIARLSGVDEHTIRALLPNMSITTPTM